MKIFRKDFLLSVLATICFNLAPAFSKSKPGSLRSISAVFRHGDRTVAVNVGESYPNDPYLHKEWYPEGIGQLTNIGKRRAYEFGLNFRERYNTFLDKVYVQNQNRLRSTAIIRSKMTLQLMMAAVYPPSPIQLWNKKLKWQPIDFTYTPILSDGLLLPFVCPSFLEAYAEAARSDEVQNSMAQFDDLFDKLTVHTGMEVRNTTRCLLLYQTLYSQSHMGLTLPKWTREFYPDGPLKDAGVFEYRLQSYGETLKRRNGGILLHNMIEEMASVINGSLPDRKLNLYSAQDVTVAAMLLALGVFPDEPPAYTSSVILELHQKGDAYFVKVVHYLGIPEKFVDLTIPGCDVFCPFNDFVELMQPVMPLPEELTCVQPEQDQSFL